MLYDYFAISMDKGVQREDSGRPDGQVRRMFSVMTAVLSPRVLETLAPRRDLLFQTLTERAGVLCVQPSSGVCLLQGEWEAMKKAYVILEELCLQGQSEGGMASLFKSRDKSGYQHASVQAHYHKMAEEAIKGLTPPSPMPDGECGLDGMHPDGPNSHELYYKEQQMNEMHHRNFIMNHERAMAAHRGLLDNGHPMNNSHDQDGDGPPVLEPERPLMDPPRPEEEEKNQNGPVKLDMNDSGHGERKTPSDLTSNTAGESVGGEEEEEEEDEGALQIALSDEEGDDEEKGSSPNEGNTAQNLSIRSKSQDTDGSSHSPYSPNTTSQQANMQRAALQQHYGSYPATPNPDLKPDPQQLRAMAQFYAMQQNVLNYGYLAAETRKLIEARMAGGGQTGSDQGLGARLIPPGMQYPPPVNDNKEAIAKGCHMTATDLSMMPRRPDEKLDGRIDDKENPKHIDDQMGEHQFAIQKYHLKNNNEDKEIMVGGQRAYMVQNDWHNAMKSYQNPYINIHPGNQQPGAGYECPACLSMFPNREAVQEHMLQAHAVGPGLQGTESKGIPQQPPQQLQSPHLNSSPVADAYCCPVCGKFYKSGQRLREHILLHDKNYQRPQYPCPACGKTFTYRHNMKVHFQKIHKGKQPIKRHECSICGQKFHKPVYLRHHLLRHKEALYSAGPFTDGGQPLAASPPSPMSMHHDGGGLVGGGPEPMMAPASPVTSAS